ncbi:hypothetical protein [Kitasatospora griseola]
MDRPTASADPKEPALGLRPPIVLEVVCGLWPVVAAPVGDVSPEVGRLPEFSGLLFAVAGAVWARRCWRNAEALASGSRPLRPGRTTAGRLIPVLEIRMRRRILLGRWWTLGVSADPILVHLFCVVAPLSALGGLLPGDKSVPVVADIVLTVLFIQVVRRITARRSAVLDVPAKEDREAAVEAGRAKLSAE